MLVFLSNSQAYQTFSHIPVQILGAACTYIKRGNWVECIKSTSLPMGVLEEVDMETITKKLYDGDFVIMVSDGIVDALNYLRNNLHSLLSVWRFR